MLPNRFPNEPASSKSDITLKIYLYENEDDLNSGTAQEIPSWYDCWIGAATSSDWGETTILEPNYSTKAGHMTVSSDASGYYLSYTFQGAISTGTIYYYLMFESSQIEEEDGGFDWNHQIKDQTFEISKYDANGTTIVDRVVSGHNLNDWVPEEKDTSFSVTIALKDSSTTDINKTSFSIEGSFQTEWAFESMTSTDTHNASDSYHQYITFTAGRYDDIKIVFGPTDNVWYDWGYVGKAQNCIGIDWSEEKCYSWYTAPEWGFNLSEFGSGLDDYSNLLIIFTLPFSSCANNSNNTELSYVTSVTYQWS